MNLSIAHGWTDRLPAFTQVKTPRTDAPGNRAEEKPSTSAATAPQAPPGDNRSPGTRLITETREDLDGGGYRQTRVFEREDGRNFTKFEEFTFTADGARKTVTQQNPSGSITRYEEVLDLQDKEGNFRRTQRFQDVNGDVSTQITTDYKVTDAFILMRGAALSVQTAPAPFQSNRGTQLDLRA